jgi:hypothetical protein
LWALPFSACPKRTKNAVANSKRKNAALAKAKAALEFVSKVQKQALTCSSELLAQTLRDQIDASNSTFDGPRST